MSDEANRRRGPFARITNAAAGALDVNEIVERVDVNEVVQRIDIDEVVGRIEIDRLVKRIDIDDVVRRIDIDAVVKRIDIDDVVRRIVIDEVVRRIEIDDVVRRIEIDAVVKRIDIDDVVRRIEIDAVVKRIDIDDVVRRIEIDAVVKRIDIDDVVRRIVIDDVVRRIDIDAVVQRIDIDAVVDRVDMDKLLARVDPNKLLDRIDVDALLDRVDIDRLVDRMDIKGIVDRAGVADIVGDTTGQVAGSVLDAGRRQIVAVDQIVGHLAYRIIRRDPGKIPGGPALLVRGPEADSQGRGVVQGHYAGPVSRLLAFLIDIFAGFGIYTVFSAAVLFFVTTILRLELPDIEIGPYIAIALLLGWALTYSLVSLVVAGRTLGKGVIGLMVVSKDGSPLTGSEAVTRVLSMPLSFIFFGLGLLGIAFGARRQAWHDKIAGTAVVYDWGSRSAALPAPLTRWIDRHDTD